MLKFPIAMAIGLTVASVAAHADTIVIQGTPSFEPAIISNGPMAPFPMQAQGFSILSDPAFHRMADMCETLGFECGADVATAYGGVQPVWTPQHRADAEKRLALLTADRAAYAAALEAHFDGLPDARLGQMHPQMLFGWNAPHGAPHLMPRPRSLPHQFGNLLPLIPRGNVPHIMLPRPTMPNALPNAMPHVQGFPGFTHRLNSPGAVIPYGLLPRYDFPWRSF